MSSGSRRSAQCSSIRSISCSSSSRSAISLDEFRHALLLTFYTLIRVVVLIALATLFWVPVGVWIGLRPRVAEKIQPLAQFLAAFPANVLFPIAVIGILQLPLDPDIWLSLLIIFGTQWYIVFNVIAGAMRLPQRSARGRGQFPDRRLHLVEET